jgi:hypothetical protein
MVTQAVPRHSWFAPHVFEAGAPHAPPPSQRLSDSSLRASEEHLAAAHTVSVPYLRQAPAPLQKPSFPQVDLSAVAQSPSGSVPARTGSHWPFSLPVAALLHEAQRSSQRLSQQTLSTQEPVAHSALLAQPAPRGFLHSSPTGTVPLLQLYWQLPLLQVATLSAWAGQSPLPQHWRQAPLHLRAPGQSKSHWPLRQVAVAPAGSGHRSQRVPHEPTLRESRHSPPQPW